MTTTPDPDWLKQYHAAFERADAARERDPLPPGEYHCHLTKAEPCQSRNGLPAVKLTFTTLGDGDHAGRLLFYDVYLTEKAMTHTKRDLLKLGVTSLDQLRNPLPLFRCTLRVSRRTGDSGTTFNRVDQFAVLGTDEPARDPFAPPDPAAPPPEPAAKSAAGRRKKGAKK